MIELQKRQEQWPGDERWNWDLFPIISRETGNWRVKRMNQLQILLYVLHILHFYPSMEEVGGMQRRKRWCVPKRKGEKKDKVGGWNVGRQIFKSPSCFMEEEWIPYEGKEGWNKTDRGRREGTGGVDKGKYLAGPCGGCLPRSMWI